MQFLESSSTPLQSLPPLRGAGAAHSRLRQCVHSVLHADHLLHSVHAPSTVGTRHSVSGKPSHFWGVLSLHFLRTSLFQPPAMSSDTFH